jgi:hypothetical protein
VPRGLAHTWTRRRLAEETLSLLRTYGSLIRQHVITDVIPFNQAACLFDELANRKRDVLQAVFKVFDA